MTPARLAAQALALVPPDARPIAVVSPGLPALCAALAASAAVAGDGDAPRAAVVAFLGAPARPAERQSVLRALERWLPTGAPLVVVDHNQPRTWWRRAIGVLRLACRGLGAGRARYPAAREVAALGFHVERLCLTAGEGIQLVVARRS